MYFISISRRNTDLTHAVEVHVHDWDLFVLHTQKIRYILFNVGYNQ